MRQAAEAYFPVNFEQFPLSLLGLAVRTVHSVSPEAAYGLMARVGLRKFNPIHNRTPYLSPLRKEEKVSLTLGELEFSGWRAGKLLLLEDAGHSPDSIAIFDPRHRLLLVGDLLYEYNPLWPSGTYGRSIDNLKAYRALAAFGEVAVLADSHTHKIFRGPEEIVKSLDGAIQLHEGRRRAILEAAGAEEKPTVESVRCRLLSSDPEFARLSQIEFPQKMLFTRSMIAVALREARTGA